MRISGALGSAITVLVLLGLPGQLLAAAKYTEGPVKGGGTISGKITFAGTPPAPEMQKINKDMEVCGGDHRMHETVRVKDGALADVVVFLPGITQGKAWPAGSENPEIIQKDCSFRPYFQPARIGVELKVKNGDPVSHNIHTYEIIGGRARISMFNVQQPAGSDFSKKIRMRRDRVIRLECDQHDFMIGWMYAMENPYYAVAADDGLFSLEDVPAGTHKLKAWHPYLGFQEADVTVDAGGSARVDLAFK
jgi:hypothetical protein